MGLRAKPAERGAAQPEIRRLAHSLSAVEAGASQRDREKRVQTPYLESCLAQIKVRRFAAKDSISEKRRAYSRLRQPALLSRFLRSASLCAYVLIFATAASSSRAQDAKPAADSPAAPQQTNSNASEAPSNSGLQWSGLTVRHIAFEGVTAARLAPLAGHLAQVEGAPMTHAMGTNSFSAQWAESFRRVLLLPPPHSTPSLRSVAQGRLGLLTTNESRRIFESGLERMRRSSRLHG